MRFLFERAAFRAGWHAARAGTPFHENPFVRGALARFERQWACGWAAANDYPGSFRDWEYFGGMFLAAHVREAA
ncbi:hypothetical protein [Burkholderia sp. BCC1988]|uniref:hypothetical protein n=1 Tax=Burkholderia sp. BCC1988 TaxID=2817443 RepID=UPI002AB27971|nr:hypothetical protein [Burkholderia sp. BCC1988]